MKWLIVILATCALSQAAPNLRPLRRPVGALKGVEAGRSSRIFQAEGNADPMQFPYHAHVLADYSYLYGGALISTKFVLTSALAIYSRLLWQVTLGATVLSADDSWVQVRMSRIANAHSASAENNIGLIQIEPVELTDYVKPALLPRRSDDTSTFEGKSAIATGFGLLGDVGERSDYLRYVRMSVLSNSECTLKLGFSVMANDLCAEGIGNTCPGDNGGALVVEEIPTEQYKIIGVIAFGAPSCESGLPSGFSRVTSYLSWIETLTGIEIIP